MTSLRTADRGPGPAGRTGGSGLGDGWDRPARLGWLAVALLVLLAIGGLLLRLWILGNAPLNSDEATAGLVAHEIARGHFFAFYWGQSYGGVEPYVLAFSFLVAGQSPLTLNGTPVVLALVGSVLVWRIGLHLFPRPAALAAAVLSWIWSESTLWNSTKEYGFHQVSVVLGLVVLLQAVRIVRGARTAGGDRTVDWLVFGAAVGLGFWASPEVVYFALPGAVVVLMALRHRSAGRVGRLVAAGAAAVAGALPSIWATAQGHSTAIPSSPVPYLSRLGTFFSHVLPMILGLRIEGAGVWELGHRVGPIVYALLLVVVAGAAVLVAAGNRDARVLVLALALFPFLYAAFPTSWFWNDGRYAIGLTPVVALLVIGALWQAMRPATAMWVAGAALVAAFATTLVAFNSGYGAIGSPGRLTPVVGQSQSRHHLAGPSARAHGDDPRLCGLLGGERPHLRVQRRGHGRCHWARRGTLPRPTRWRQLPRRPGSSSRRAPRPPPPLNWDRPPTSTPEPRPKPN